MNRAPVVTLLALALFGCGPGANQRTARVPQADTPPDPPAELASAASSSLPQDPSDQRPAGAEAPRVN